MMKLYSAPLSLFSRKVEIALREKGLSFERVMVPFDQSVGYHPKHPDVLAANPKNIMALEQTGDIESARGHGAEARAAYNSALQTTADRAAKKRIDVRALRLGGRGMATAAASAGERSS